MHPPHAAVAGAIVLKHNHQACQNLSTCFSCVASPWLGRSPCHHSACEIRRTAEMRNLFDCRRGDRRSRAAIGRCIGSTSSIQESYLVGNVLTKAPHFHNCRAPLRTKYWSKFDNMRMKALCHNRRSRSSNQSSIILWRLKNALQTVVTAPIELTFDSRQIVASGSRSHLTARQTS